MANHLYLPHSVWKGELGYLRQEAVGIRTAGI